MTAEPEKIHYRETMQRAMQTAAELPRTIVHLPTSTAPTARPKIPTPLDLEVSKLRAEVAGWKSSSRAWEKRYKAIRLKLLTEFDHREGTK